MNNTLRDKKEVPFEKFCQRVTCVSGSPRVFFLALLIVLVWLITGPIFNYSDTWQLFINTGTTIVTFLMVFIIQQSQNKESLAVQLKLNELISATKTASNRLIDIEDLNEKELTTIKEFYVELADLAEQNNDIFSTHSLDEAQHRHQDKSGGGAKLKKIK